MGKQHSWTALAGLAAIGLASGPLAAAPPAPLPAESLDFRPWGDDRPADALCRGIYVMPDYRVAAPEQGKVASVSELANYGSDGETILAGEVILRRDTAQLESPNVRVPSSRDRAFAEGPLALRDENLLVRGDAAELALNSDAASIDGAHYVVHDQHLRGDASRLERLEDGRYRLSDATFTTCDPGSKLWRLVGGDVLLDREQGFGTARHARLEVGHVPVFYWPWVRFPIDDRRQTGFLWPSVGFSDESLDYAQPFYWNIAPNQDATITPRWITDRGLLLGGEYRYLLPSDAGQIEGAFLSGDDGGLDSRDAPSRRYEGEDRWYLDYRHAGRFDARTRYQLRYGAASDGRYFEDFGSDFGEQTTNAMARLAQVDYRGDRWLLDARAQGFQRLNDPLADRDKPFYRLPSLSASARWDQPSGLYQQWRSNATYFWRDVDENRVPLREAATGTRVHLSPAVGWRAEAMWGHLEPRVEWLATAYDLDYGDRETERSESLQRNVPVASIDGGLVFDRELDLGGRGYRQTLEPRINYAFVPARDQSEFPDFDASERPFSWNQLWSPRRFSGADRVGDLNRISLGVESRLLDDQQGRERLSVGIGQSAYFDDRHIDINGDPDTLPNRDTDPEAWYRATRDRSPLVSHVDWRITEQWRTRWEWLYDDQRERTERTGLDLQYRSSVGHVLNLGYRWELQGFDPSLEPGDDAFRNFNREEANVSFAWKASPRVDLIGRFLYDNTNDRPLEQLAGVQWNDCCYGLQLVWREWVDDNDTARVEDDFNDRGIFLRFVFKGLGGVGRNADSYFEEAIPGYRSTAF
ncbi:LPS-assembly protein LptD [Halomonas urumqiensis]|uniref:LPS-assembly protein LptD n=1 Tax=Halomonas urumqiensis TaxID=1684789 RepID=A0A2N7UC87_9GAMM|nr:LPS-assembly protein LptD [Halomonas urumqiensis]PMR78011.1 LPS-assembly protein LptD [Halomonas urumqiensis]PTB03162.1 LPS-assembly protein LptD [Halomonas urumqiensis]GHE20694.1 LPS-assembly protein LptD [Halomonas urumqiensis]